MANLSKYLKPEEIKEIQAKGSEFIDKFEKQMSNQLYRDANFLYNRVQLKQMEKATEKYENPLNSSDWSSDEIVNHALEEMVDLSHYITLVKYRFDEYKKEIEDLTEMANYWKIKYKSLLNKEGE
jgi:hypothetical protein